MSKVHILPALADGPDPGNGGIQRVITGQLESLPKFGWEYTSDPAEADVIACHVEIPPAYMRLYPDKPFVIFNHGAYWSPDYQWEEWCYATNVKLMGAIRAADAVTAVSEWVANTLRRHSSRDIRVIYHGVDLDEWQPFEDHGSFVLWNKTRVDPICDPTPVNEVAKLMPDVPFVTTFGDGDLPNVDVTGRLAFDVAKDFIRRAGVYLCTTRETFGIGTLEALACGVPVVGYRWGGQVEIIEHGVDGWLVPPGDFEGLAEGIRWARANRDALVEPCRRKAEQFPVDRSGEQYAALFDEVLARKDAELSGPAVSVIVPVHNMGRYLDDTLSSIAAQTMTDWECVIVDDASPDPMDRQIAERWVASDGRFRLIVKERNEYLAAARNTGIEAARGRYIMPLDADDMLTPTALAALAGGLDANREVDIAYGGVLFVNDDGRTPTQYEGASSPGHSGWPVPFRLDWQLQGPGQLLPYASMYRKRVWESVGGYRRRARSSEDCEFWLRTTSYGFTPRMVTPNDTLIYRNREGSMSRSEGWEEHRGWFPWVERRELLPAAAVREGVPASSVAFPALDPAAITVVIPVGPGHAQLVVDAVDSVEAQTFRLWQCVVIRDCPEPLPRLPSWVKVICSDAACDDDPCVFDGKPRGVATARNRGIAVSDTPLFLPLDADDYLQPIALQIMLDAHLSGEHRPMVYSDFWEDNRNEGEWTIYRTDDYDPVLIDGRPRVVDGVKREGLMHAVTVLTPKSVWDEVGGYDENLPGWEDWAFAITAAVKGFCSRRVALPLFNYRKHSGLRREANMSDHTTSKAAIMEKDFGIPAGGEPLACSRCPGGAGTTAMQMQRTGTQTPQEALGGDAQLVRYNGGKAGTFRIRGALRDGIAPMYPFSAFSRERWVASADIAKLLQSPDFEIVQQTAAVAPEDAGPAIVAARTPEHEISPVAEVSAPVEAPVEAPTPAKATPPSVPPATPPPVPPAKPTAYTRSGLMAMTRAALDEIAADRGITGANMLPNKERVVDVIIAGLVPA
ncbi:hypothetical protein LCGC14_1176340 [marine sediment metagenome]|uniref:Glycosyltransferase 2-like domain-containing protein n=1 Tax=marine sediment metagenome TaxID=412755 RepID=A0A0F9LT94_9ZZZZ